MQPNTAASNSTVLQTLSPSGDAYLEASEYLDWQHPEILALAATLANGQTESREIAKRSFKFVRDEIKHSADHQLNPVTCKASDVLRHGTGFCYAKSHLLAALLRANGIPAGLCYQRLTIAGGEPPFCLHGLNAVHLEQTGWYRIDPRGNKPGVSSQFEPDEEKLAYPISHDGERDIHGIYSEPLPEVIEVLTQYSDVREVAENLPDCRILSGIG